MVPAVSRPGSEVNFKKAFLMEAGQISLYTENFFSPEIGPYGVTFRP